MTTNNGFMISYFWSDTSCLDKYSLTTLQLAVITYLQVCIFYIITEMDQEPFINVHSYSPTENIFAILQIQIQTSTREELSTPKLINFLF